MTKPAEMVRQLLRESGDLSGIKGLSERQLYRALMMLTHDDEDIVRHRACRHLAEIIAHWEPAKIDNLVRRLLWRLNPESGDHPVGLPELLGEIGNRAPKEIRSFVSVILYYLDDEKLLPGLLQAAGRIGEKLPQVLEEYVGEISRLLKHKDPLIAGNAALALHRIGSNAAGEALQTLHDDTREIELMCGDDSRPVKLCEFAKEDFRYASDPWIVSSKRLSSDCSDHS